MLDIFYPIVPDVKWIARLVPRGIKTIQLRLKEAEPEDINKQISESLDICDRHNCQLIVNDYWQQAIALGATYIHLGQEDLAGADVTAIRTAGLKLGISTHNHEELETALRAAPDYVALGPIYETKLKKMKWAPQGLARVTEWKSLIPCPLVAIGGLTIDRAKPVFEAGADSLAVVTDIVTHPEPEEHVKTWMSELTAFHKT